MGYPRNSLDKQKLDELKKQKPDEDKKKKTTKITADGNSSPNRPSLICDFFRRKQLFILLMGSFALPAKAQCEAKNDAFQSGEHVMYDFIFQLEIRLEEGGVGKPHYQCNYLSFGTCIPFNLLCVGSKNDRLFSSRCVIH